jgi:hypothetical protein
MTQSTRPGSALAKQTEASMRGTFYSSATPENPGERRILESFKLSNILELSDQEKQIVSEIKRIMEEECDRL